MSHDQFPGGPHGQPPNQQQSPPGYPPSATPNYAQQAAGQYAHAQHALKGAGSHIKLAQMALGGLGALIALGGLVMLFTVGFAQGLSTIIAGGVLVFVAMRVMPKFVNMVGSATAQVDALAAQNQLALTGGGPAMGQLLQVQQTGVMVNYNPEVVPLAASANITTPHIPPNPGPLCPPRSPPLKWGGL